MTENSAPPILTKITPTHLECTLHSVKYHCLIRLRSIRCVDDNSGVGSAAGASWSDASVGKDSVALPDISSLGIIPIHTNRHSSAVRDGGRQCGEAIEAEDDVIHLLPKLYRSNQPCGEEHSKSNRGGSNIVRNDHPAHDLLRIAENLEVQLRERLRDASDGAVQDFKRTSGEQKQLAHPSMIWEEFLLRSESILHELLSAVEQQIRKEQAQRSAGNEERHTRKRKATYQAMASSTSNPAVALNAPPPLKYYAALTRQLQMLQSTSNVTDINLHKDPPAADSNNNTHGRSAAPSGLTRLSVSCLDKNKRSHTWHAVLYPSIVLTVDLPSELALEDESRKLRLDKWWEDGRGSQDLQALPQIHHRFQQALAKYQSLFAELDDLDSHLWILEPSLPASRCSVERRIALWEGGASMVIALDPDNPRGVPAMVRFLGVTVATMKAVASAACENGADIEGGTVDWRTSFAEFVSEEDGGKKTYGQKKRAPTGDDQPTKHDGKRWSEDRSVRENLEMWFGSPLPSPLSRTTEASDFLVECGICYAHRLPTDDDAGDGGEKGPLPEVKCGNASCNRHYHESCLFEWLHSLPTAKVSFDRIYGTCPYCCEVISVQKT